MSSVPISSVVDVRLGYANLVLFSAAFIYL